MTLSSFDLIKILREKIGEEQASALTNYIETKVHEEYESKKEGFATKEDIAKLETKLVIQIESIKTSNEYTKVWLVLTMFTLIFISTGIILYFMK